MALLPSKGAPVQPVEVAIGFALLEASALPCESLAEITIGLQLLDLVRCTAARHECLLEALQRFPIHAEPVSELERAHLGPRRVRLDAVQIMHRGDQRS